MNPNDDDVYFWTNSYGDSDYFSAEYIWWNIHKKKEKLIGKIWDNYEKNSHPLIKIGWKIIDKLADLLNWFETKTKKYKQYKEVIDKIQTDIDS